MLKTIDIKGLAVVDKLSLELNQGMTVLTGETGAGKSILLTAMKLCLGDRADASLLRPGVDKADVTLDFDICQMPEVQHWLQHNNIDEPLDCLIRRTVNADGRSRAFINGQAVTLKTLQELAEHLISVHGQHAHLDLLQNYKQGQLLDAQLDHQTLLEKCAKLYQHWKKLNNELLDLTDGNNDNDKEKQLLKYQLEELQQSNLLEIDYDELVEKHALIANMSKIITVSEKQISILYESDHDSIHSQLSHSLTELEQLSDLSTEFSEVSEQIKEALIQIQEASRELRHKTDDLDDDPQLLQSLDKQLSTAHDLARKLHIEPQLIADTYQQLLTRYQMLEQRDERLTSIQIEIDNTLAQYADVAKSLHQQRTNTAKELATNITKTLRTLGLPDGKIEILVTYNSQAQPTKNGFDEITFMVTTNPGMPPSALNKVASGGELSRISLAIQVVTSQSNTVPTLVFDEVDAGIGGGVAETVGVCLRDIATNRQVICVTHLPQVASQGHHHLLVSKHKEQQQTKTDIRLLDQSGRVNEIARMLGGVQISERTLAHAQEMLGES
ncbi:MAG: DNA repair protein RecN [Cycloclasticus sp.]|nr:DNA repair protein RecN [Cycloclasticus sp.]MBQ0790767.1 DNA repair protein RecN [Cycloclasticus sp.]